MRIFRSILRSILLASLWCGSVRADLLVLQSGLMDGEILNEDEESIRIKTRLGTVDVPKSNVKSIQRGKSILDLYREKWMAVDHEDPEARVQLALWAKKNGLSEEAELEFKQILAIDPDNGVARRYLGYEKLKGKWMPVEEAKRARGLVKYRGRWMKPEERKRLESIRDKLQTSRAVSDLFRKMRRAKTVERDALTLELYKIKSPFAAHYIARYVRDQSAAIREAAVMALGRLKDQSVVPDLAKLSMQDSNPEIRRQAAVALGLIGTRKAIAPIVPLLLDRSRITRIRAAKALGHIGHPAAVPYLISSLYIRVETTSGFPVDKEDQDKPTISSTTTTTAGGKVTTTNDPVIQKTTTGLGIGLNAPKDKDAVTYETNAAALAALKKITGEDFDYNKSDWREWWEKHKDDLLSVE